MRKVIACTGYGGTGSSVVSDLFKEFDNVKSFGEFEFRFLQDPGGLRELEFGIIENNDRLLVSYYVNKYIKYVNYLCSSKVYDYERFFGGKFKELSHNLINDIVLCDWVGFWHQDIISENVFFKFIYYLERFYQKKIMRLKEGGAQFYGRATRKKMYYAKPDCEFISNVKKYTSELVENTEHENKEFIVFDQLVPASNVMKYVDYFNDIKVIVVDRDPRDLYLLNKIFWKEMWIPSSDVSVYIDWYKGVRRHQHIDNESGEYILRVKFEDFIYKYDQTIKDICDFSGVKESYHNKQKKHFNPDVSINNTNLKVRYPEFNCDVELIERELAEYCYPFES